MRIRVAAHDASPLLRLQLFHQYYFGLMRSFTVTYQFLKQACRRGRSRQQPEPSVV